MLSAAQRQQKLAAKTSRRKDKAARSKAIVGSSTSLPGLVRAASKGQVVACCVSSGIFECGIGHVFLARRAPTGLFGYAHFLIDTFCLGVKDVYFLELGEAEFKSVTSLLDEVDALTDVEPAYARKLIRDAAAYAADLGFAVPRDMPVIEAMFGDVDPDACNEVFTFGQDGKPVYIRGPNDTPARIRKIINTLENRGEGRLEFIIDDELEGDRSLTTDIETANFFGARLL